MATGRCGSHGAPELSVSRATIRRLYVRAVVSPNYRSFVVSRRGLRGNTAGAVIDVSVGTREKG